MKPNNRPLFIVLGILAVGVLCACAAAAVFFGAMLIGNSDISQVLQDPSTLFEEPSTVVQPPIETPIPVGEDVDLAELFAPMWEGRSYLQQDFFEQPVEDAKLNAGALEGLSSFLAEFGIDLDNVEVPSGAPSAEELLQAAATPEEAAAAFAPFWEAWRKLQYGDVALTASYQELMRISLRGMVNGLGDDHTGYLDPFELAQSDLSLEGEYEGIGAWVDTTTEYVTIIAPMEGSPAEAAGLLPGDLVIAVDGQDMTGVEGDVVISYILGPAGSTVVLTIQREGEPEPFDVSIVRSHIFVPSVQGEMLENDIAYVQLFTFASDTAGELNTQLEELLAQNPRGLILDLRNNGGGYLDTAVSTTSEFLEDGLVLIEEYGDGTTQEYEVLSDGLATDIPLIVLVNPGTASASEIMAGAIQDYERGMLVGETTYGKGSVQISRLLSNDQGALRITVAHWLTPLGRQIHGLGLEPDVVVVLTEEDLAAELDPQLDRAIELILEQTN